MTTTTATRAPETVQSRRFRLEGVIYTWGTSSDVTLRDLLLIEQETLNDLGRKVHMGEIQRMTDLFASLTPDEAKVHEDAGWMLTVNIWVAMVNHKRERGDLSHVPFAAALDAKMQTFEIVPEPTDHQAATGPKAKGKSTKRNGSGSRPAAARAAAAAG